MSDHAKEFSKARAIEVEQAEQKRFNTMLLVSAIIALAVATPMLGRSAAMTLILALTYVPFFALAYIGATSAK